MRGEKYNLPPSVDSAIGPNNIWGDTEQSSSGFGPFWWFRPVSVFSAVDAATE